MAPFASLMKPQATRISPGSKGALGPMPCAGRTGRVICRVSPEEQSGFIAKDNSGKANMYPVMPKAYEAGSSADSKEAASSSLTLAAGAGLVAIGAVVVGLGVLSGSGSAVNADEFSQFLTLAEYSSKFAAEI